MSSTQLATHHWPYRDPSRMRHVALTTLSLQVLSVGICEPMDDRFLAFGSTHVPEHDYDTRFCQSTSSRAHLISGAQISPRYLLVLTNGALRDCDLVWSRGHQRAKGKGINNIIEVVGLVSRRDDCPTNAFLELERLENPQPLWMRRPVVRRAGCWTYASATSNP
jgi:hypothetical protein